MFTIIKIPPTSKPIIFHPMMIFVFRKLPGTSEILIISHLIVTAGYVKR